MLAPYDPVAGEPVAGEYSKYYTGEAYWALARLHRAFPGEGWGEAADRIGAYLATSRDEVEDNWPPIPDHWAAYGAAETVEFPERGDPPLTAAEAEYGRRQAELFGARPGGSASGSGRGARWCAAATRRAAAATVCLTVKIVFHRPSRGSFRIAGNRCIQTLFVDIRFLGFGGGDKSIFQDAGSVQLSMSNNILRPTSSFPLGMR